MVSQAPAMRNTPTSDELARRLISLRNETRATKQALRLAQLIEAGERERTSRSAQHST